MFVNVMQYLSFIEQFSDTENSIVFMFVTQDKMDKPSQTAEEKEAMCHH